MNFHSSHHKRSLSDFILSQFKPVHFFIRYTLISSSGLYPSTAISFNDNSVQISTPTHECKMADVH